MSLPSARSTGNNRCLPAHKRSESWPADKVERRPIKALIPAARNARTHTEAQVDQIAASIREWGWTMPVLVTDAGTIIAGHGRVRAAQKLGLTDVPVMVATGWTKAQIQAYAIADNKLALNAGWDEALLSIEIGELQEIGFDIDLIGFSDAELAGLASRDDGPDRSRRGAGCAGRSGFAHRRCLGARPASPALRRQHLGQDVKTVLGSVRPHLMVTDPPYGVDYDPAWRADANKWKGSNVKIGGKAMGRVSNDDLADWTEAWALFPGDVAYVWHGGLRSAEQASSLERASSRSGARSSGTRAGWSSAAATITGSTKRAGTPSAKAKPAIGMAADRVDGVGYPQAASIRDRSQHAEAGRVHEAADREQLLARPGGLRAVQRIRHDHHRRRDHRPVLPRDRADAAVRRCRGRALAGIHRRDGETGDGRPDVCARSPPNAAPGGEA